MRIAVDVDEVLADMLKAYLDNFSVRFKTSFSRSDFNLYSLSGILGVNEDFAKIDIHKFIYENGADISPVEGADRFISLIAARHELVSITARQPSLRGPTEKWLETHFPGVFSGVYFTNGHSLNGEPTLSKAEVARSCGAELLIDDHLGNCVSCARDGIDSYLFSAPWNVHLDLPPKVERVFSWGDVYSRLAEKS